VLAYYVTVALIAWACFIMLLRGAIAVRHVLMAIRENQLRATFQGYPVETLQVGVLRDLGRGDRARPARCSRFQTYLVSAEAVSVPFSGELLAMVVIGGMRSMLPALGALFFILFREFVFDLDAELAALVRLSSSPS